MRSPLPSGLVATIVVAARAVRHLAAASTAPVPRHRERRAARRHRPRARRHRDGAPRRPGASSVGRSPPPRPTTWAVPSSGSSVPDTTTRCRRAARPRKMSRSTRCARRSQRSRSTTARSWSRASSTSRRGTARSCRSTSCCPGHPRTGRTPRSSSTAATTPPTPWPGWAACSAAASTRRRCAASSRSCARPRRSRHRSWPG